jgi:hypothetical protein
MDGTYLSTLAERAAVADTAILIRLPIRQCLFRIVKRGVWERRRERPDLNPGCPEQVPRWDFVWYTLTFNARHMSRVMLVLEERGSKLRVVSLESSGAVASFLEGFADRGA